jgi:hypothetical protein
MKEKRRKRERERQREGGRGNKKQETVRRDRKCIIVKDRRRK